MKPFLGTFVEIGVEADHDDCEASVNHAFDKIKDVHEKLSFQDAQSELSILNGSHGKAVVLSRLSVNAIKLAKVMTLYSNNYFNCTVGNYFKNENFVNKNPDSKLFAGSSNDICISGNQVKLRRNITLILDGIAKGFAVDLAVRSLTNSGIKFGWVNAGGDLRVFGDIAWPIYIKNIHGQIEKSLLLKNAAIATSNVSSELGDRYPSRFISTHSHPSNIGTWSVLSRSAWRADALTKVAANAPSNEKEAIIKKLGGQLLTQHFGLSL